MFKGSYTALITPFRNGRFDENAYANIIKRQIDAGSHGIVPVGTTGESPTLSHDEHQAVVRLAISEAKGKCKVMAGAGSNSTEEAVLLTQNAEKMGADAALVILPYYNKPTPNGVYLHYKEIVQATDNIPIIIYNVPGRTVIGITDELIARLNKEFPTRIVGLKDATADMARPINLHKLINPDFSMMSGEDDTAVEFNKLGGVGCISVSSNVIPKELASIQQMCLDGNFSGAETAMLKVAELHDAMFVEANPVPVKYACHLLGLCELEYRLPMCSPTDETKTKVKEVMQKLGLI
jgi:4-hydroxy-tetrahydrodipicolinate synthase